MDARILATGLGSAIGAAYWKEKDALAVVEWAGCLSVVDRAMGTVQRIGTGWVEPEGIALAPGTTTAYVTERGGDILAVDLESADRAAATVLASGLDAPHQPVLSADGTTLAVVEFGLAGRLLAIDVATGVVSVVTAGLERGIGLALTADGSTAYVTEQATTGGRVTAVSMGTGLRTPVAAGLDAPFMLAWADGMPDGRGGTMPADTYLLLAERDPRNAVTLVDVTTGAVRRLAAVSFRPSSILAVDDRLYAVSDADVTELDASVGLLPTAGLRMPTGPLFVGGFAKVGVELAGGLTFDDLTFEVDGEPVTGAVSYSRDSAFDPAAPDIMLLAGSEPGTWGFRARETATGTVLAEEKFQVTSEWPDEVNGASIAFAGETAHFLTGAAWGGGPAGPQNVNVLPASGTRRVAIILVDTSTARYPTGAALTANRDEWRTELLGGTDPDGIVRGVRQYYQEVSYGRYDISLVGGAVNGPFALADGFDSYFDFVTPRNVWWARGNLFQAAVTAAQGTVDFDQVDSLVVVVLSPGTGGNPRFSWPVAGGGNFTYRRPGASSNTQRAFPALVMPHDWESRDSRRNHETLAHELGHNLGLPDLYMNLPGFDPAIQARDVGSWDLMSSENPLPHMTLVHRMMLGWVQAGWVRSFDFRLTGGVDQTVTLQAAETIGAGGPAAGRVAGIEVRRADGWNYYFEYRAGQVAQIGDRQLSPDRRVLGTDVVSGTFTAPVSRRDVILLPNDVDGDGPVLGTGADYGETDTSGPAEFTLDVVSTAGDSAVVRIRYGSGGRPDPSIRPWPGGTNWQSPDIEVRNARSSTRPEWRNSPWAGQLNTVVATVVNRGTFVATSCVVEFYVKDFTIGGAPETLLGRDTRTIAAGASVEFSTTWTPPATPLEAHYCIIAKIPLYIDPGNPTIVELTELNNVAQSNYTRLISSTASPATRETTYVTLSNPYSERTRMWVQAQQSTPWYRTYLEHAWLWLEPGETRKVRVQMESLLGAPDHPELREHVEEIWKRPHELALVGLLENSLDPQLHTAEVCGGANVQVVTARATRMEIKQLDGNVARGRVLLVADGSPVPDGDILVSLQPREIVEKTEYRPFPGQSARLAPDGEFAVELGASHLLDDAGFLDVEVHYLGAFSYAPCSSGVERLER